MKIVYSHITEKSLWYALKRFDFIFRQIGEPVYYHGLRIPYLGVIEEIERHLMKKHMNFYQDFLAGLDEQYWPVELRQQEMYYGFAAQP